MIRTTTIWRLGPMLLLLAVAFGCSTSTETGQALVGPDGGHPAGFPLTHPALALQDTEECRSCHGDGLQGGISGVSCFVCHTNTANSPLTHQDCTSCHGNPPAGAAYPNVTGAHAVHLALNEPGSPVTCATCHFGLGSGTLAHYDRANGRPGAGGRVPPGDAAFDNTYDARTGAIAFDDSALLSCSNVSCHGGQATPNWQSGTIDVNDDCSSCHQLGTDIAGAIPQYNVYFSGQHKRHVVDRNISCAFCHAPALLAGVHFDDLSTPAMTEARATINVALLNFDNSVTPPTCSPAGCHSLESWTQQGLP